MPPLILQSPTCSYYTPGMICPHLLCCPLRHRVSQVGRTFISSCLMPITGSTPRARTAPVKSPRVDLHKDTCLFLPSTPPPCVCLSPGQLPVPSLGRQKGFCLPYCCSVDTTPQLSSLQQRHNIFLQFSHLPSTISQLFVCFYSRKMGKGKAELFL